MKKIVMLVLFTALVTCVFAQNGVIREMTGVVEVKHEGAASFVPAASGTAVKLNTIISTGFKSTAIVVIGNSVLTVRPLTRLSLAEIQSSAESENVNINLQAGRVKVDVNPPSGTRAALTVQSPSATASVRGTSFEFDTVNLRVDSGSVVYSGNSGPAAMVATGSTTYVGTEGTAVNPVEVSSSSLMPPVPAGKPQNITVPSASASAGLNIELEYQR